MRISRIVLEYVPGDPPYIRFGDGGGTDQYLHPSLGDSLEVEFGLGEKRIIAEISFRGVTDDSIEVSEEEQ